MDKIIDTLIWIISECLDNSIHAGEMGEMCAITSYYRYTDYYNTGVSEYVPITIRWNDYQANTVASSKYAIITSDYPVSCTLSASGGTPQFNFVQSAGGWTYTKGADFPDDITWTTDHTTTGNLYCTNSNIGYYYGFGWANGWTPAANFYFGGLNKTEFPDIEPQTIITNLRLPNGDLPTSTTNTRTIGLNIDPTETWEVQDLINQIETDLVLSSEFDSTDIDTIVRTLESTFLQDTTNCCGCTTINVYADGTVTVNNDIDGTMIVNVDNNADLTATIQALAGAFGAGAINISPEASVDIQALAGAFGAGAFGAGAIVSPDVTLNGSLDVGDISGTVTVSGDNITIDQSGGTVTNNYNTTNNYYYDPTEPDCTINYDEILSEGELESILDYTNNWNDYPLQPASDSVLLPSNYDLLAVVPDFTAYCDTMSQVITDSGLMPVLPPVLAISFILNILQR